MPRSEAAPVHRDIQHRCVELREVRLDSKTLMLSIHLVAETTRDTKLSTTDRLEVEYRLADMAAIVEVVGEKNADESSD